MKKIYLSTLAGMPLIEYLKSHGFELCFVNGENSPVYKEISTHADIYMCQLGFGDISHLFMGNVHQLGTNYPGNILYNAICTGKYFIHNFKYTSPELMAAAKAWHNDLDKSEFLCRETKSSAYDPLIKVNVPQGYTRCCCLPVDDTSFITSDQGIAKALASHNADVLLIERGHVKLPGFNYGFIGGCAGNISISAEDFGYRLKKNIFKTTPHKRAVIFNGNLGAHPDYEKIAAFIKDRDIDLVYFKDYPLEDIGSIMEC